MGLGFFVCTLFAYTVILQHGYIPIPAVQHPKLLLQTVLTMLSQRDFREPMLDALTSEPYALYKRFLLT